MQWLCGSRTNRWDRFDYRHALAIGLGTLAIGLVEGLGLAAVSGAYAGVPDLRLNGGISC